MSSDYNYDEQGQFFPFFILTIAGLVTLPLTYSLLKPSTELENTAPRIKSDVKIEDESLVAGQRKKQARRERRLKRAVTAVGGFAVMGYMVYLIIVTQRTVPKIWDPYDILGIARSATEKAIKKQYRSLTLKYHPDKVQLDPALNETMESATNRYVEISKAYKALTDEDIRNNYMQYGHPDGKQSFSIGIALPKFIITDGAGKYVLLAYGLLLGVLLPYVVGKWWYGTQRVTKEKVLVASAGNLFREWEVEGMSKGAVVAALSSGEEYKEVLSGNKADAGLGKVEKAILAKESGQHTVAGMTDKDSTKLQNLDGVRRKALALLWAYLGRVDLKDTALNDEKYEVAPLALALNDAFVAICLAYGQLNPLLSSYKAGQHIIQALPPDASPLLQLPHITPAIASAIEGVDSRHHLSLQDFMAMPEYRRRKLATDTEGPNSLTPQQYNEAVAVARQLPYLHVESAFFKCRGEKHIVTGSLVQFVVKARFIPPGTANVPAATPTQLEDLDPDDDDPENQAAARNKSGSGGKKRGVMAVDPTDIERNEAPPLAHAPYFARDHSPRWHLLLSESKQARVAVPPSTFSTFDRPIFDAEGRPTLEVQTLKLQFAAPPQPGQYTFVMQLVCDSYVGFDAQREVTLVVEDPSQAVEIESEEEISEPDEDTLAGQMRALQEGRLGEVAGGASDKKKRKRAKKVVIEDDSDESDTDGDSDEESSATDTDTDSEAE